MLGVNMCSSMMIRIVCWSMEPWGVNMIQWGLYIYIESTGDDRIFRTGYIPTWMGIHLYLTIVGTGANIRDQNGFYIQCGGEQMDLYMPLFGITIYIHVSHVYV